MLARFKWVGSELGQSHSRLEFNRSKSEELDDGVDDIRGRFQYLVLVINMIKLDQSNFPSDLGVKMNRSEKLLILVDNRFSQSMNVTQ